MRRYLTEDLPGGLRTAAQRAARAHAASRGVVAMHEALALPFGDGPKYCTLVGSVARVDRDSRGLLRGLGVSFTSELPTDDRVALTGFLKKR